MKVCVMDIATIKTARIRWLKKLSRKGETVTRPSDTRLMCIAGARPVNVPARMPARSARSNEKRVSMSILSASFNYFICLYLQLVFVFCKLSNNNNILAREVIFIL